MGFFVFGLSFVVQADIRRAQSQGWVDLSSLSYSLRGTAGQFCYSSINHVLSPRSRCRRGTRRKQYGDTLACHVGIETTLRADREFF